MPEMSGKCKLNPTKINYLIYIMIFSWGEKNSRGGGKKLYPPPEQNPYLRPVSTVLLEYSKGRTVIFDESNTATDDSF